MKKLLAGFLIIAIVAASTYVFAFGPGGRGSGFGPQGKDVASNLNLTKEQTEKMWLLKDKFYTDTRDMRYQMFQKRTELHNLYSDPKAADATIMAKQKELNALRAKLSEKKTEFRIAQRHILTPEQIQKLDKIPYGRGFSRFGGCAGKGFGPRGGGGFGPRHSF